MGHWVLLAGCTRERAPVGGKSSWADINESERHPQMQVLPVSGPFDLQLKYSCDNSRGLNNILAREPVHGM